MTTTNNSRWEDVTAEQSDLDTDGGRLTFLRSGEYTIRPTYFDLSQGQRVIFYVHCGDLDNARGECDVHSTLREAKAHVRKLQADDALEA